MKTLHSFGISTNIIDNNEISTNATIQTQSISKENEKKSIILKKMDYRWFILT